MQSYVDARGAACPPPDTLVGAVILKLYELGAMEVHCINLTEDWKSEWVSYIKMGFIPIRFNSHNYTMNAEWSFAESNLLSVANILSYDLIINKEVNLPTQIEYCIRKLSTDPAPVDVTGLGSFVNHDTFMNPARSLLQRYLAASPVSSKAMSDSLTAALEQKLEAQKQVRVSLPIENEGHNFDGRWQVYHNGAKSPSFSIEVVGNTFNLGGHKYVINERPQPAHFRWPDGTLQTATVGRKWIQENSAVQWQAPGYTGILWTKI